MIEKIITITKGESAVAPSLLLLVVIIIVAGVTISVDHATAYNA